MTPQLQPDDTLMTAALEGDRQSFRVLVSKWKGPMVNYFYQQLWNREQAEDLAQEVFVKVWNTKRYNPQGQFSAWLFAIARRTLIDFKRKKHPKMALGDHDALLQSVPDTGSPEQRVLQSERLETLTLALNKLPEDQRQLILMAKYEQLKYKDLATVFHTTESNIKVKVHRVLARLKKKMKGVPHG